jgi:hypothetical protein
MRPVKGVPEFQSGRKVEVPHASRGLLFAEVLT